jgi:hypothetical protein
VGDELERGGELRGPDGGGDDTHHQGEDYSCSAENHRPSSQLDDRGILAALNPLRQHRTADPARLRLLTATRHDLIGLLEQGRRLRADQSRGFSLVPGGPPRQNLPMADLPSLLTAISANPDDGVHWRALAQWYSDNGQEDEAIAIRVFWPTLRDNLAFASLETTLADAVRNSKVLAELAREVERRAHE